jgi:hypothetical protein
VNLAVELGFLGAVADAQRHGSLVVEADVGGLVRGEDHALGLLDASGSDFLTVDGKGRLAALAEAPAVVDEVEFDSGFAGGQDRGALDDEALEAEEVVFVGGFALAE